MREAYSRIFKHTNLPQIAAVVKARVRRTLSKNLSLARILFLRNPLAISILDNDPNEYKRDEAQLLTLYTEVVLRDKMREWPEGVLCFQWNAKKTKQKISIETASHTQLVQQLIQLRELRENFSNAEHSATTFSNNCVFQSFLLDVVECASVEMRQSRDGLPKAKRLAKKNREQNKRPLDLVAGVLFHLVSSNFFCL